MSEPIQRGNNMTGIARDHRCTIDEIMAWNPKIKDRNRIYAGDYLYLRAR